LIVPVILNGNWRNTPSGPRPFSPKPNVIRSAVPWAVPSAFAESESTKRTCCR